MEDKLKNFKPLSEFLDSVRSIDGFPIGEDKDILALSDAPYYTACPNPYINDFIEAYGTPYDEATDTYERKPYVEDVSEGKTDPIYLAHTYHTKVPHKAIMRYIEHYTKEGDIVLDGFGGSGMTAVASKLSSRNSITLDLSPNASFLQESYVKYTDPNEFENEALDLIEKAKKEIGWLYEVDIENNSLFEEKGQINYSIWSDLFTCPYCKIEYTFWDEAVDFESKKVREKYVCPHCKSEINKKNSIISTEEIYDVYTRKSINRIKSKPIVINYTTKGERKDKKLESKDIELLSKIQELEIPNFVPADRMPLGSEGRRNDKTGNTHTHHFFTKRNLWAIAYLFEKVESYKNSHLMKQAILSILGRASKMYRWNGERPTGTLSGTLYIGSLRYEFNILDMFKRKVTAIKKILIKKENSKNIISTQSITDLRNIKSNAIDYIFTDPPFGDNLMYSELNFINESWLKVKTNIKKEAIINKSYEKNLLDYKNLMTSAMKEYYRILKPNRWITVEFHNSKASVWNAIQESITKSGFIIAQVAVLDKKQGSFKQVTSAGAVSKDLVINAYKPKTEFKERFLKTAGEGMEVEFVKQQLNHLPIEPNVERTEQMLYSKMLAHYIENGFKIKYNSQNFFELLENNFVELDGYWFDESEVLRYNEWKSKQGNLDKIKELKNSGMILFINNEKTALQWIYQFLNEPRSYSDILTSYNMIVDSKSKDEIPELREMLDNNFFTEEGKYRRPYTKDERKQLKKHREKELEKAWEKILERAKNEKNKMKTVRKEALEYGFKKCYDEENYQDIILVGKKLHDSILEENSDITEFIEIAEIKLDI